MTNTNTNANTTVRLLALGRNAALAAICFWLVACTTACATQKISQNESSSQSQNQTQSQSLNHSDELVDVRVVNPSVSIDIRYATTNNFTKQKLYTSGKRCFLRRSAAEKIDSIQRELATMGLGLKIFDGYRPLSAQKKMWAIVPDENYVANPARGSRHNRGAAVDVTLVRIEAKPDGTAEEVELLMPTPFDDFTENAAHRTVAGLPAEAIRNRFLLKSIMEKHGFTSLPSEWWHYDEIGWQRYDVLDIDSVFHD